MFRWSNFLKRYASSQTKKLFNPTPFPLITFQPHYHFTLANNPGPEKNSNKQSFDNKSSSFTTGVSPTEEIISLLKNDPNLGATEYTKMLDTLRLSKEKSKLSNDETITLLRVLYKLGNIYRREGKFEEALKYYEEGLPFASQAGIHDSAEIACITNAIGDIYLREDNLDDAELNLNIASEIFAKLRANKELRPQAIMNLCLRATFHDRKDEVEKSVELYKEVLKLAEDLSGEDRAKAFINAYDSLGYINLKNMEPAQAVENWLKGLDAAISQYGKESLEAKNFHENLVWAYLEQGQYDDAVKNAERCLVINLKNYNTASPEENTGLYLLGHVYNSKGEPAKALESYERVLRLLEGFPKKDHDQIGYVHGLIAKTYLFQNNLEEGRKAYNRGLKGLKEAFGEESVNVAECYTSWGDIMRTHLETIKEAQDVLKKALAIYQKHGQTDTPRYIDLNSYLGEIAYSQDQYDEALKYFKESLRLALEKTYKPELIEEVCGFIGEIYSKQGKYDESIEHYAKAIQACAAINIEHPNLDFYYRHLGEAYEKKGSLDKARETYQKALDFVKDRYGKEDETTKRNAKNLADVLVKMGKVKEAADLTVEYDLSNYEGNP